MIRFIEFWLSVIRFIEFLVAILLLVFGLLLCRLAAGDATSAHIYADHVLYPKLISALDDYALQHSSKPGHEKVLNAGDVKRWRAVREAFKELDRKYGEAGY